MCAYATFPRLSLSHFYVFLRLDDATAILFSSIWHLKQALVSNYKQSHNGLCFTYTIVSLQVKQSETPQQSTQWQTAKWSTPMPEQTIRAITPAKTGKDWPPKQHAHQILHLCRVGPAILVIITFQYYSIRIEILIWNMEPFICKGAHIYSYQQHVLLDMHTSAL